MLGDRPSGKGRSFERLAVLPPYVMMLVCMVGYVALAMVLAGPTANALGWQGGTLKYALLCLAAWVYAPGTAGIRCYARATLGCSLAGALLAARHVWLQGDDGA